MPVKRDLNVWRGNTFKVFVALKDLVKNPDTLIEEPVPHDLTGASVYHFY